MSGASSHVASGGALLEEEQVSGEDVRHHADQDDRLVSLKTRLEQDGQEILEHPSQKAGGPSPL